MKYGYFLSHLAKKDLEEIWDYTLNHWSLDQANFYYQLIIREIEKLCLNPHLGKSLEIVIKGYRAKLVKSYMIVFKIEKNTIFINRILHQSMDIESLLSD